MSTKQEIFNRFYNSLSDEEKSAGPKGLPDFVTFISKEQPPLSAAILKWARGVALRYEQGKMKFPKR